MRKTGRRFVLRVSKIKLTKLPRPGILKRFKIINLIIGNMKKIFVEIVQGNVLSVDAKGFVVPQFADKMSLTGVSGILSQNGHFAVSAIMPSLPARDGCLSVILSLPTAATVSRCSTFPFWACLLRTLSAWCSFRLLPLWPKPKKWS